MYDAALFYRGLAKPGPIVKNLLNYYRDGFYLATVHRQENTDNLNRLRSIMMALEAIAERVPVIMPLHPRTRNNLYEGSIHLKNVCSIDPVGYFDMICLLDKCRAVFTDSGGVQKEAYFFRKPCITLRDQTEWVELVEHGFNVLVGADGDKIIDAEQNFVYKNKDFSVSLYGDGNAGEKIVELIIRD